MKQTIYFVLVLTICVAFSVQPASAINSVETAEPMEVGKNYTYTYLNRIDDKEGGWYPDSHHFYSFVPKTTENYSIEVKGDWLNENTHFDIKDDSGRWIGTGHYNSYLKRVVATTKLYSGVKVLVDVWAGGESSTPQDLTTTVSKHTHEISVKDSETSTVQRYSNGVISGIEGGYLKCCQSCNWEEYVEVPAVSSVKLSASKLIFNGKVQKPKVTVRTADGRKLSSFRLTSSKSKTPGRYKLILTFTGDYAGTIKTPYNIVPAKPGAVKLKATKRKCSVSWKKSGGANGYEIQYSTDRRFKSKNKCLKLGKGSPVKAMIKNLSKGTYYVRVRAINGKTCSVWSQVKSVKVK